MDPASTNDRRRRLDQAPGWQPFFESVEQVSRWSTADAFSLGVVHRELVHSYHRGFLERTAAIYASLSLTDALPGPDAYLTRTPRFLEDRDEARARYPMTAAIGESHPYGATACLPLLLPGGRRLGYLALHFAGRRSFPDDEQQRLRRCARSVADGLHRLLVEPHPAHEPELEALTVVQLQAKARGLTEAMESRAGIERARGILMERRGLDAEEAWSLLLRWADEQERTVHEVAAAVVHVGPTAGAGHPVGRTHRDRVQAPAPPHEVLHGSAEVAPSPVRVLLLHQWYDALAYDHRVTPRGPETLVAVSGDGMSWVPSQRVVADLDHEPEHGRTTVPTD